jgi:hypothetical protein
MPRILLSFALLLLLAACGSASRTGPNLRAVDSYPGLTCAPFARELSGVALYGDAASWWELAQGRYSTSSFPEVGSVLVFRRSSRLPSGHVAVISRVLGPRQVHVIEANWVRGELEQDQLVIDVSEGNDWTLVRVWWPPLGQMGSHAYATYGFILPPRRPTHDALARDARTAAARALASGG